MNRLALGLLVLVSCTTRRNPDVCCTNDLECARLGLPPGSADEYGCSAGYVCREFYCTPEADAGVDGMDVRPVVENGQRADLVLGQEIFTVADANHGGLSDRSLSFPSGVAIDETDRLWIVDSGNNRALMWSPAPPTSFAPAGLVVGSTSFAVKANSCVGATTFTAPYNQLSAKGGKLVIPTNCNRVMIWNPSPTANGGPASIVLGQASFNDSAPGTGAADLDTPSGAWTDGTRVVVADTFNSRVLIWTSFPTTNKQPADLVLGQPGFGMSGCPAVKTGATMCNPRSVYSDGVRLFVADSADRRVLVWRSFPTVNGQPADFVIGQSNLTGDGPPPGPAQQMVPYGVIMVGQNLFVSDIGRHRVLVFSPIPDASGASASFVLGQPGFDTTTPGTTQETLRNPYYFAAGGNKLYVSDAFNHRVLRFDLKL